MLDIEIELNNIGLDVVLVDTLKTPTSTIYKLNLNDCMMINYIKKFISALEAKIGDRVELIRYFKGCSFALEIYDEKIKTLYYKDIIGKLEMPENSILLGIDRFNAPIVQRLDDMPHLLVAGATGSGKSVCMNVIITSLMQSSKNTDIILIDPKRVEFARYSFYNNVTLLDDYKEINKYLYNLVKEMTNRYDLMKRKKLVKHDDTMRKIVVIVDEYAELVNSPYWLIQGSIKQIARLGRAAGIHLILATQRPTVDIVNGEIKANINCRLALQMASARDSMNILGHKAAERLRGRGDAWLKLASQVEEIHIQVPFID